MNAMNAEKVFDKTGPQSKNSDGRAAAVSTPSVRRRRPLLNHGYQRCTTTVVYGTRYQYQYVHCRSGGDPYMRQ